ncbi:MAG: polysaccharide biosynthesis/export family protein [Pseudomonadota bacterium]
MIKHVFYIAIALFVLVLGACSSTPVSPPATPAAGAPVVTAPVSEYRLGPQDQIRVTVFGQPELSGEFVVGSNGKVSLPLIGDVDATGLTVSEFQRRAETLLLDGYLNDPKVSAEVMNHRPYYILGEVNTPGQYQYANGLTVMNAIATAGGFTYRGNTREVMIKSNDSLEERRVRLSPSLVIQPGDTIRVLERIF